MESPKENSGIKLFEFQKEAIRQVCEKFKGRALVALDMGLGKTPVGIVSALKLNSQCTVVVCPASLRLNWEREIRMWSAAVYPTVQNWITTTVVLNGKTELKRSTFIVISYEQATSRIIELASLRPDMVVVDESHYVKNREAKRTKAVVALCRLAPHCLLLSGTPMLNRPIELWCQLEALNFSLGSYWEYAKKYCGAHQGKFGWDVSGATNLGELNAKLLNNVMIRKRKSEVLTELPDKRRVRISVGGLGRSPMGKALRELCVKALKKNEWNLAPALEWLRSRKNEISDCVFSAYSELAVLKAETAKEIVLQMLESGEQLVVFAHHKTMIRALCDALSEAGIAFSSITGDTPLELRQKCVDDFQAKRIRCCVLSITAASTGLTLTAASDMLICELPFAPGLALQAEDRIHRIGQKEAVLIRYLCADNTLDDSLWRIISSKNRIANHVLDGVAVSEFSGSGEVTLGDYWLMVSDILKGLIRDEKGIVFDEAFSFNEGASV